MRAVAVSKRQVVWGTILWGFVWLGLILSVPEVVVFTIGNAFDVGIAVAVIIAYGGKALEIFRKGPLQGTVLFSLGVCMHWCGTLSRALVLWFFRAEFNDYRDADTALAIINHPLVSLIPWFLIIAGFTQLSAQGVVNGVVPRPEMIRLGLFFGGVVVVAMLAYGGVVYYHIWAVG